MPVITEPPPTVVAHPTPDTTAAPALPSAVYVPGIRYTNDTVARSDARDFEDYSEVVYQPEVAREAPTTVAPTPLPVAVVATTAAPPPVPATAAPVRGLVEGDEDYEEMYAEVQASTTTKTTTTSTPSAPVVATTAASPPVPATAAPVRGLVEGDEDYEEMYAEVQASTTTKTTTTSTPSAPVVATTAASPPVPATAAPVRGLVEGDEDYEEMYAEGQASTTTTTTTTSTPSAPVVAPPAAVYLPQPAVTYVQNLPGTKWSLIEHLFKIISSMFIGQGKKYENLKPNWYERLMRIYSCVNLFKLILFTYVTDLTILYRNTEMEKIFNNLLNQSCIGR